MFSQLSTADAITAYLLLDLPESSYSAVQTQTMLTDILNIMKLSKLEGMVAVYERLPFSAQNAIVSREDVPSELLDYLIHNGQSHTVKRIVSSGHLSKPMMTWIIYESKDLNLVKSLIFNPHTSWSTLRMLAKHENLLIREFAATQLG